MFALQYLIYEQCFRSLVTSLRYRRSKRLSVSLSDKVKACGDTSPNSRAVDKGIKFWQLSFFRKKNKAKITSLICHAFDKESFDTLMGECSWRISKPSSASSSVCGIISQPSTRGKHKPSVFRHGHMFPGGCTENKLLLHHSISSGRVTIAVLGWHFFLFCRLFYSKQHTQIRDDWKINTKS